MTLRSSLLTTTIFGAICWAPQAVAAEAPTPAEATREAYSGVIAEVVVTARRVEESLQTTPIAVTAVGGQALERARVANVEDLQGSAPSLAVSRGSPGSGGFAYVSIRGQGNLQPIISTDPAVATYIDGVYVPRPAAGLTEMYDMQRVEILRGPQGTLFGRNTTGGALNLISRDPVDRFEGSVKGEVGNFAHRGFEAVLNVPLAENLAARAVYNFRHHDGYGRNATLNREVGDLTSNFARAKIKYDAENFDIALSGDYNKITDHGQLNTLGAYRTAMYAAGPFAAFGPMLQAALHNEQNWYTTYGSGLVSPTGPLNPTAARDAAIFASLPAAVQAGYNALSFDRTTAYGAGATVNIDLASFKLKSTTGFRHMNTAGLTDLDGSSALIIAIPAGSKSRQWSQEVQLSGDITEQLSIITGGYASRETGSEYTSSQAFGGLRRSNLADAKNISKGLYAQAYYELTDTLRATGGFRYTWDTRITNLRNSQVFGLPTGATVPTSINSTGFNCNNSNIPAAPVDQRAALAAECNLLQSVKFSYPAWTAGLDWQATDDIFVYAVTRGAARAGGWNIRAGSLPSFSPEKVKDVEGGVKVTWLDRRLRTNVAVFKTWKTDVQVNVAANVPVVGNTSFIQNQGRNEVWGAEFEITAVPWEGMEITGNASLLDGKWTQFQETQRIASATPLVGCASAPPTAAGVAQFDCIADLSDLPLQQFPKTQFSIGFTQQIPVGDGNLSVHADYAYISGQYFQTVKAAPQQTPAVQAAYADQTRVSYIAGYGLLNGRIGYELDRRNVEIYVYGRNLAAKKYNVRTFADLYTTGGLGVSMNFPGNPRTFGVGVQWKFGQ